MLCFLVVVFSIGCTRTLTTGKYFDISKASGIQDGITTKGEIVSMFGQPHNRAISGSTETWSYFHSVMNRQRTFQESFQAYMGNIPAAQTKTNMLTVSFMGDVVETHSMNMSGSNAPIYTGTNNSKVITTTKQQSPVYTSKNSNVYHKYNCPKLDKNAAVIFASSREASMSGGVPCQHCNPS